LKGIEGETTHALEKACPPAITPEC
jgi:hypothetical protein